MRVFVTGATGWVGRVVVDELLGAGHRVLALARSKEKAAELLAKGAHVLEGTLDDTASLADAARTTDAVIHLAFDYDVAKLAAHAEQEQRVIAAMGEALIGTDKRMLVSSGLARLAPGRVSTEADLPPPSVFPRKNEAAVTKLTERGVRASTVRLATTVHGVGGDRAFMKILADLARDTGVSAYSGDGTNQWPAVHVSDAGRLYRLALEAKESARAYHASAENVPFRAVAEAIGRALGLPCESRPREHFGWFADFASADSPTSTTRTRALTGWVPAGPTLLEDLAAPAYFER